MEDSLIERFGKLTPDVLGEFMSMLRVYHIDAQELFFKWESYCIKMGNDGGQVTLDTAREFKKDVQDALEREMKTKVKMQASSSSSKPTARPPRSGGVTGGGSGGGSDHFGLLDGLTGSRAGTGGVKRKVPDGGPFNTPKKSSRFTRADSPRGVLGSSPLPIRTPLKPSDAQNIPATPFSNRSAAGSTIEILNDDIPRPSLPLSGPTEKTSWEQRVSLVANMDIKKFAYRPMHQKLYESSEILDEKIEEVISLVQEYHKISPNEIGDPSTSSQSEIVAVGRIASDALEGKFNAASVVLESCRRVGAGSRVALKLDEVRSFSLFPGQVVALRGINPGGKYFVVKEILEVPTFPVAVTPAKTLEVGASRLSAGGLNLMIASGPYTTDDNLLFESLEEICNKAVEERPDIVILLGPFIDLEHPLVADGDFELDNEDSENGGTLEGLFRERIGPKIKMINKSMVIMLPSTKDAVSKHVSYPQEHFSRRILDLPKNVKCLPNPAIFSLNEILFAASTNDILFHLSREEIQRHHPEQNMLARSCKHIIQQRNFYPLFPPPAKDQLPKGCGTPNLDIAYMKLCDFVNVTPDVLILPSQLMCFAKIVDSVVAINPGFLSKRQSPGTYAAMTILPRTISDEELVKNEDDPDMHLTHRVYERARVDILRI